MSWLVALLKALLEGALSFVGARMDRAKAEATQREASAYRIEAKTNEQDLQQARAAATLRARPVPSDAELDDFLRAPGDRGQKPVP